ncbi:MAG: hypothetical protein NG737_04615 [Omnitrophica bacterium]|nr:hypothetical protein [Candidatus Omnitrophota bacterium]
MKRERKMCKAQHYHKSVSSSFVIGNRLKKISSEFKEILDISSELAALLDSKVYLVGGVVRDLILEKDVFDLDIVVEGDAILVAKEVAQRIGGEFNKHHNFGTATVAFKDYKVDFATARTEKYLSLGSLPKVRPDSLIQDLSRRDFTINAMAISLNKPDYGKLIDSYNGLADLRKRLIRTLHPRSFLEDPTRILRAIRFEQRFRFIIEGDTFKLMKEAINSKALKLVNPHRLRDEIVLILKEPDPCRYIKRIKELEGFLFLDDKIKLDKRSFQFFLRLQRAVSHYQKKFKKHRTLQVWLMYLAGILIKLDPERMEKVFHDFGFRKGERIIIRSIKVGVNKIKRADKNIKAYLLHRLMSPYSFESILFFYAYYPRRSLRKNIENFLDKLIKIRLKTRGRDLKALNLRPFTLYSKALKKLLYVKIEKGLKTKKEELMELKYIFKNLVKSRR